MIGGQQKQNQQQGFFPDQHPAGQIVQCSPWYSQQQQQQGDNVNLLPIFLDRTLAHVASDWHDVALVCGKKYIYDQISKYK